MPASKFDLVQNLPQIPKPQFIRLNSTSSLTAVITGVTSEEGGATAGSPTCGPNANTRKLVGLNRALSEPPCVGSGNRKCSDSRCKLTSDTLSQHQPDDQRSNYGRKTVILLEDNNACGDPSHSRLLDDKGFSTSTNLSVIYGIILGLFGVAFPITEALQNEWLTSHVVGVFMTYLFSGATAFIIYLEIYGYILKKRHDKKQRKHQSLDGRRNDGFFLGEGEDSAKREYRSNDTDVNNDVPVDGANDEETVASVKSSDVVEVAPSTGSPPKETSQGLDDGNAPESTRSIYSMNTDVSDDVYNYITMQHGTPSIACGDANYFLKIGLLVFAVANMVYVALRIEGEHQKNICSTQGSIIYPHYVHLAFIILQTFFLTKVCKHALRSHKMLVNFGLMHVVATNLCVWFRYLVIEVVESLHKEDEAGGHASDLLFSAENNATNTCLTESIMVEAGHYLFPFILEYSLIAMTAIIFIYSNINIRVTAELYRSICEALHKQRVARAKGDEWQPVENKHHVSALEKSHRGLAMGVVVLAGVVVSIVLFFYWKGAGDIHKAQMCHAISELIILLLFILNTLVGMCHLYHFIFNPASVNTLDNTLLLISANFLLVLELFVVFSKIAYMTNEEADTLVVIELISSVTCMIQAILQVAFITDGMQRVSVKEEQIREKRGRGVITFLIILNAAMWIFESFQEKYSEQMEEIEMYGEVAWAIISSVSHPLQLFFYFHSSICLAHMWHHCYEKPEDNPVARQNLS